MNYRLKLSELEVIVEVYGKVKVLENVLDTYKSLLCYDDVGLCSCLYNVLFNLPDICKKSGCVFPTLVDECDLEIPHFVAYNYIFPLWCKSCAWALVYRPKSILDENKQVADWWIENYWWPREDHEARFQFLDKMIDIYKNKGGMQ